MKIELSEIRSYFYPSIIFNLFTYFLFEAGEFAPAIASSALFLETRSVLVYGVDGFEEFWDASSLITLTCSKSLILL